MNHSNPPSPSTSEFDLAAEMASIQPRLYGFILKRLADREQTLEVLQRTNLVLCRRLSDFEPGSSFAAWAFTIAKFQVMAWRKSEGAGRLVFTQDVQNLLDRSVIEESNSVDQRIPVLRQCLQRLKTQDRVMIQERYRDGISIAEIANAASKSAEAVTMQLSRIRAQLRDCVRMYFQTGGQT